ncbi:MAG: hypothetical protein JNM68_16975, partial [Dinghuibacter sp.]|nr:hypothetical protein [Dinghuibacter sp.]
FNNKRLLAGFQFPLNRPRPTYKSWLQYSLKPGFGIDFKGTEADQGGNFLVERTNLCGEVYYLEDSVLFRSRTSWILPFQVNIDWFHKQKKRLQLSAFIHLGFSKNVLYDIYYVNVTLNTREKATFLSRGTGYGIVLSYPIRVYQRKPGGKRKGG